MVASREFSIVDKVFKKIHEIIPIWAVTQSNLLLILSPWDLLAAQAENISEFVEAQLFSSFYYVEKTIARSMVLSYA